MDISVITPFYRGNAYMERLVSCIRRAAEAAPALEVELILVNDSPGCPIELSPDWVRGFSVQILDNPQNLGIHGTRLNGLSHARGTFVLFLDQDDVIDPQIFASQYALSEDCDVVLGNGYNENAGAPIYASLAHQRAATILRYYYAVGCMIVSPGQCLIRREAIPRAWRERCLRHNGADDLFLWLLMLHDGCRWAFNPQNLYTHVDTGGNLSANLEKMIRSCQEVLTHLTQLGILTPAQARLAARRFDMRRSYEGKPAVYKLLAMVRYPDLTWALLCLKARKTICR